MLEVNIENKIGNFLLDLSFTMQKGVLAILGASGSGKSMTLKSISGLLNPQRGCVNVNGKDYFNSNNRTNIPTRKRNIGYVFQNYALFPHLTVEQNIAFGLYKTKGDKAKKIRDIIEKVRLTGFENRFPSQLSGGQQQRVALARTLVTEPELLLLDEPLSALDVHVKHSVEKELIEIIKNNYNGMTLIVTHNIEEAFSLSNNIMVMDKGSSVQYGTKHDIINSPVSVTAARLTGCKNFFEADIIGENYKFYTLKIGELVLTLEKKRTYALSKVMVGIRAHHIVINPKNKPDCNTFEGEIISTIEGVFSTTVIVKVQNTFFEVTVSKSNCPNIANCKCKKKTIYLPPEKMFLVDRD